MTLLDRYIAAHIIRGTLLVLAVLVALFSFIAFVDDLDSVGRGDYTLLRSVEYMVLTLPRRAFEIFPIAAVVGSLMGLGTLAAHSELIVARASGVSVLRIATSVIAAGAVLMVAVMFVGEVVAPVSERLAHERRSVALTDRIALKTGYGFWVRDGKSFINIRKVLPNDHMKEVYIYEFDDAQRLRVSTFARDAYYRKNQWLLEGIEQSVLSDDGIAKRMLDKAAWKAFFAPDLVSVVAVRPEGLSAIGLQRYIRYLESNGLNTTRYEVAFWNKLAYPLATGVMVFLAIPLVLGRLRSVSVGLRVLVGTLVGLGFHVLHQASMQMGIVFELNPLMSTLGPTVLFLGVGLWMMRRVG